MAAKEQKSHFCLAQNGMTYLRKWMGITHENLRILICKNGCIVCSTAARRHLRNLKRTKQLVRSLKGYARLENFILIWNGVLMGDGKKTN